MHEHFIYLIIFTYDIHFKILLVVTNVYACTYIVTKIIKHVRPVYLVAEGGTE